MATGRSPMAAEWQLWGFSTLFMIGSEGLNRKASLPRLTKVQKQYNI